MTTTANELTTLSDGTVRVRIGNDRIFLPVDGRMGDLYIVSGDELVWMGGAEWTGRTLRLGGRGFGQTRDEAERMLREAKVRRAGCPY